MSSVGKGKIKGCFSIEEVMSFKEYQNIIDIIDSSQLEEIK